MADILIVGGYGHVGRLIAQALIDQTDQHIILAGRNMQKAERMAGQFGTRASGRQIDLNNPAEDYDAVLQGVQIVVMCLDLPQIAFARACFERGIHYVDISAEYPILDSISKLHDIAYQHQAIGILGVGLIPGLSNLLVKHGIQQVTHPRHADISVLLGLGDAHGKAAIYWTLSRLGAVRDDVPPNTSQRFPAPYDERKVYPFEFADQYIIVDRQPIASATTWFCLDSKLMTGLIGLSRRLRLTGLLQRESVLNVVTSLMQRLHIGSDAYAVSVAIHDEAGQIRRIALSGNNQSKATADVAAHVVRRLLENPPTQYGVFYLEDGFDIQEFGYTLDFIDHSSPRLEHL